MSMKQRWRPPSVTDLLSRPSETEAPAERAAVDVFRGDHFRADLSGLYQVCLLPFTKYSC